jgi:hypothetical protein
LRRDHGVADVAAQDLYSLMRQPYRAFVRLAGELRT